VIEDRLMGRPNKARMRWSVGFLLGSQVETRLDGPRANIKTKYGRELSLRLETQHLSWAKLPAPHSPAFNCRDMLDHLWASGSILGPQSPYLPHVRTVITASCAAEA
jgi:hypothetical protein